VYVCVRVCVSLGMCVCVCLWTVMGKCEEIHVFAVFVSVQRYRRCGIRTREWQLI